MKRLLLPLFFLCGSLNSFAGPKIEFVPVDKYSTPAERAKIAAAGLKANEVVQSKCFAEFMSQRAMIQTNGKTPSEVVTHLQGLAGRVQVRMYMRYFTSAVAYRQPPEIAINLNRKFFTLDKSDCVWAGTLMHEGIGHALGGYDHDYKWNPARSYSVPYSLAGADKAQGGSAFDACCK